MKDKRIILFEELLSSLLKLPHLGNKYLELECRKTALRIILQKEDVDEIEIVIASTLSLKMRLFHNFISRIFIPRIGRFD